MVTHDVRRQQEYETDIIVEHVPGPVRPRRGQAIAFLAVVSSALTLRMAVTSLTPLLGELQRQLGFSNTMTGVFGLAPVAMFGLAGFITPLFAHRFDLERVALGGAVLTFLGLVGRGFAAGAWDELCWYALALAGMGVGNIVTPPLVKRYFPKRIAAVSTWYSFAVQFGAVAPPVIAVQLQQSYGWRLSLGLWALAGFLAVPLLAVLAARRNDVVEPAARGETARVPFAALARSKLAWGMAVLFGVTSLDCYAVLTWLPKRLAAVGLPAEQGGLMIALYSVVGVAGPLIVVPLLPRVRAPFVFVVAGGLCHLVGFAGLFWAPGAAPALWTVFLGLGPITFAMNLALIGMLTRTSEHAAALSGFAQGVGYMLAISGPFLFGVLYEQTGAWGASFAFLAAATVIGMCGGWFVCQGGYIEDEIGLAPKSQARPGASEA
ncbi:major facilitator superfamily MFS_1 [Segniliparus rotundus DSM 44985]|uniref:Major facilitator superfamily MFS_1 n=1 Tax=Segniliparus rotundus (strain ATCC BAA-972 / CDC 1076 / CIP 108378 / DSM 44985 / JCM 13578) TaxID=640132 RepID=D6ZDL0_SEGRD|nr:MFS transporter [Segniliparus rotundus]ADG99267.1 major facilitator superfamily MFS_1 [Segniliparus rotundus DSM 44985]